MEVWKAPPVYWGRMGIGQNRRQCRCPRVHARPLRVRIKLRRALDAPSSGERERPAVAPPRRRAVDASVRLWAV
jgi:hypothetical protein